MGLIGVVTIAADLDDALAQKVEVTVESPGSAQLVGASRLAGC